MSLALKCKVGQIVPKDEIPDWNCYIWLCGGVTVTSVVRFVDPASALSNLFNISWLCVTPPSSLWWIQNYSSSSIPRVGPTPPSTGVTDSVLTLSSVTEPGVLYSGPVHVYMMITSTLITRFLLSVIIGLRLLSSHHWYLYNSYQLSLIIWH